MFMCVYMCLIAFVYNYVVISGFLDQGI